MKLYGMWRYINLYIIIIIIIIIKPERLVRSQTEY